MFLAAVNVSVVALPDVLLMALLTKMSPLPAVLASVVILTLLDTKLLESVVAPMPEVDSASLPAEMVKSTGSSNQLPFFPALPAADVSTRTLLPICKVAPEVSILPPLPPSAPPWALKLPCTSVRLSLLCTSLHSTTLPPSPLCVALASMLAPSCMVTVVAWRRLPLPCQSPPTSTVPPPVAPVAWSCAPVCRAMCSAVRVISPPLPVSLLACIWPLTLIVSLASSTMRPLRCTRALACSDPLVLTTPPWSWLSAWADKIIKPPGAWTAWPLSTKALMVEGVTRSPLSWVPCICSSKTSPAAKATVPICATITPWLRTSGASRAM